VEGESSEDGGRKVKGNDTIVEVDESKSSTNKGE